MRLLIILSMIFVVSVLSAKEKISLKEVFVINGFDDNDEVQIVADGELPNICYRLGETKVKIDKGLKKILVEQFAELSEFSSCSAGGLPAHLNYPVSFSNEISLGQLAAGNYEVVFQTKSNLKASNTFNVAKSQAMTVDDSLYAPISQAIIPEMIYETTNAEVILSGIFHSACLALNASDIKVIKDKQVIVILPYLTVYENTQCEKKSSPLHKMINLGALNEGRYLLHIRSLSGKAVNKTFTVVKKEQDLGSELPYLDLGN